MNTQPSAAQRAATESLEKRLVALAREHQSLMRDLIQVIDYLDGWLRAVSDTERGRVDHLRLRLLKLMIAYGVRPTAHPGARLDLRYHEVVELAPVADVAPDTIIDIVQMGYEMLAPGFDPTPLRQAKVTVATAQSSTKPEGGAA